MHSVALITDDNFYPACDRKIFCDSTPLPFLLTFDMPNIPFFQICTLTKLSHIRSGSLSILQNQYLACFFTPTNKDSISILPVNVLFKLVYLFAVLLSQYFSICQYILIHCRSRHRSAITGEFHWFEWKYFYTMRLKIIWQRWYAVVSRCWSPLFCKSVT